MDEPRDVGGLSKMNGMARREFLQKVLAAALTVPVGGLMLSGCEGEGLLKPPDGGPGPAPQGDLGQEVQAMRDAIASVIQATQNLQGAGDIDLAAWMAQVNAQLSIVWPLMVAAAQQELRDNVSAEMQEVLDQLDQFGEPLRYSGPAPIVTQERLQDAWDRAEALLQAQPTAKAPYATEATWAFFLMLFLIFPTMAGAEALNYAMAAAGMDTGHGATSVYDLLHPASPISCTPCFIGALLNGLLGIVMLLFLAMGSHAGMAPSMLFGRDWLIMLVLLAALFMLFLSGT